MIRAGTILTLAAIAMLGLSGCNNAKSPDQVQQDVAKATARLAPLLVGQALQDAADKIAKDAAHEILRTARRYRVRMTAR